MRKNRARRWLIGLAVGVVIVSGIGIWQRENILFLYEARQYTAEEVQVDFQQAQEAVQKALGQYELRSMRELTEEEQEQLASGELSVEEAAQRIMEPTVEPSVESVALPEQQDQIEVLEQPEGTPQTEQPESIGPTEHEIVTNYTAKMYALQAKYTGKLGGLEAQGWQLLGSYKSGGQSLSQLMPQGMTLVRQAMSLESQCDGEVEGVLQNLSQELKENGVGTEIVGTMRNAYGAEKMARKRYYLSLVPKF